MVLDIIDIFIDALSGFVAVFVSTWNYLSILFITTIETVTFGKVGVNYEN
jgi:hypothetical protein